MDNVEKVAKGLSEAMRAALLAIPDGRWLTEYSDPPWPNIHIRAGLGSLGEMRPNAVFNHAFRLTPLGLAVRQYLQEQAND